MFCNPKAESQTQRHHRIEHKMTFPIKSILLVFAVLAATAVPPSAARPSRRGGPGGILPQLPILPDSPAPPARPSHSGGPAGILPILPIIPDQQPAPATTRPNRPPSWGIIPLPRILPDRPPSPAAAASPAPVPSPAQAAAPAADVEPTQCMPSLAGLVSCIDYLNDDYRVSKPMAACCGDFRKLVDEAPICLCHAMKGGDINEMMPEPINAARLMLSLPKACGVPLPLETLAKCKTEPVPPLTTVPFAPTHP